MLRKKHLDEIPQFINVLKGGMSFTGPLTKRPKFVKELPKEIPFHKISHLTKPYFIGGGNVRI